MRYQTYGSSSDQALGILWLFVVIFLTWVYIYLLQPVAEFLYDNTEIHKDVIDWVGGILLFALSVYLTWTVVTQYSDFQEVKNDLKQRANFGPVRSVIGYISVLRTPLVLLVSLLTALIKLLSSS